MPSMKIRDKQLVACIAYMKAHHEGQVRKVTGAPYYTHPMGVLELMEESPFFFPTRDKLAALLHDIKEDSPGFSWTNMRGHWGNYVAGTVCLLSKGKLGEADAAIYFNMLRLVHPSIMAIKLIDRIHNTSDYNSVLNIAWLKKYVEETVEHVLPLIPIMVMNGANISGGYYQLGVWVEDHLQNNLHGMRTRIFELQEAVAMGPTDYTVSPLKVHKMRTPAKAPQKKAPKKKAPKKKAPRKG